jgi:hypothetical protein
MYKYTSELRADELGIVLEPHHPEGLVDPKMKNVWFLILVPSSSTLIDAVNY